MRYKGIIGYFTKLENMLARVILIFYELHSIFLIFFTWRVDEHPIRVILVPRPSPLRRPYLRIARLNESPRFYSSFSAASESFLTNSSNLSVECKFSIHSDLGRTFKSE